MIRLDRVRAFADWIGSLPDPEAWCHCTSGDLFGDLTDEEVAAGQIEARKRRAERQAIPSLQLVQPDVATPIAVESIAPRTVPLSRSRIMADLSAVGVNPDAPFAEIAAGNRQLRIEAEREGRLDEIANVAEALGGRMASMTGEMPGFDGCLAVAIATLDFLEGPCGGMVRALAVLSDVAADIIDGDGFDPDGGQEAQVAA